MRLRLHTFRAIVATGLSLWLAVLACLMGCTVPALASSGASAALSTHEGSAPSSQPDLMAGMPNCPHHSGGNAPAKPNTPKPARTGGMSCCPVEVTLTSKSNPVTLHLVPATVSFRIPNFTSPTVQIFHSAEFVPPVWRSGRDTLLETRLLRV